MNAEVPSDEEAQEEWEDETERETTAATANTTPDRPLPPHLKEISSLASWTVSTHKPGNGTTALRHPSPSHFWQSDGPQPHTLNIHFFKLVSIAHMRLYIDASIDESYTPTKMELWAGTGHHDLQCVTAMEPKNPLGWVDVDLSGAGGPAALRAGEAVDDGDEDLVTDEEENDNTTDLRILNDAQARRTARRAARAADREWRRIGTGPTLCCFLVQLRIIENHQNGKDTHLRGLQIFARDETYVFARDRDGAGAGSRARKMSGASALERRTEEGAITPADRRRAAGLPVRAVTRFRLKGAAPDAISRAQGQGREAASRSSRASMPARREPDWMGELELRLGEHELR